MKTSLFKSLYFQVLTAIAIGALGAMLTVRETAFSELAD